MLQVTLPGGLWWDGQIERSVGFQPLTGRLELTLFEAAASNRNPPRRVTETLTAALASLAGKPVDHTRVAALCVADRQFLMLRLAALLANDRLWLSSICEACSALFDVGVARSALPVREAGPGYPFTSITLDSQLVQVRVPTGTDQARAMNMEDKAAIRTLLGACIVSVDGEPPLDTFVNSLSHAEITSIEEAMEDVSPAIATRLLTACPECGREQIVELDPYALKEMDSKLFYEEVHTLAYHYHWSETEILNLPSERRVLYLHLIDRARGVSA